LIDWDSNLDFLFGRRGKNCMIIIEEILREVRFHTLFYNQRYILMCRSNTIVFSRSWSLFCKVDLSFYRFLEGFKIYLRDDLIASDRLCVSNRETIVTPTALLFQCNLTLLRTVVPCFSLTTLTDPRVYVFVFCTNSCNELVYVRYYVYNSFHANIYYKFRKFSHCKKSNDNAIATLLFSLQFDLRSIVIIFVAIISKY